MAMRKSHFNGVKTPQPPSVLRSPVCGTKDELTEGLLNIKKKLKSLPEASGIYKFLDKNQKVIYVGKAKNLKNRVKNYFQASTELSPKNRKLVENTADLEWIETNTEDEALLLETNFIKELRPKYNILMKDDKNFVYIKITLNEDFPRVLIVRKLEKDGAKYFGPKTSKAAVEQTLNLLKKIFPFRDCNYAITAVDGGVSVKGATQRLPCLQYHIKKCLGPCLGQIEQKDYRAMIEQIVLFLKGKTEELEQRLKEEMQTAAREHKFERAARLRDNLLAVQKITARQLISEANFEERDVFGFVEDLGKFFFTLLQVRNGKIIGQENFIVEGESLGEESRAKVLEAFLKQYYTAATDLPAEILLSQEIEDITALKNWLSALAGKTVKLLIPQKGQRNALVQLAERNALSYAKANRLKWMEERTIETEKLLAELQAILKIEQKFKRLECFDISHLGGTDTVGAMVVFQNGKFQNSDYRHFKLRSLEEGEIDDYKAMREVLERRLKYLAFEDKKEILGDIYKIRRGKKEDLTFIQKTAEKAKLDTVDLDVKDFLVIERVITNDKLRITSKESSLEKDTFSAPLEGGRGVLDLKENDDQTNLEVQDSGQARMTTQTEVVGFVRLKNYRDKVKEIGTLWVKESERGQGLSGLLCEELIKKSKLNKIYCVTLPQDAVFYMRLGFQEIYQIPREIEARLAERKMPLERYKYLAYLKTRQEQIDKSFASRPDLLIVDGGKGQLGIAEKVLTEFNLKIPLISLAKKEEEIFLSGQSEAVALAKETEISFLIQRVRDEAHRFAITFQRDLRADRLVKSKLDEIPGVGTKLKQKLLQKFGSVERIKQADETALSRVVGRNLAKILKAKL